MSPSKFVVFFAIFASSAFAKKTYEGYQVWSVFVASEAEAHSLEELASSFDFWTGIRVGRDVDIFVSPERISSLRSKLEAAGLEKAARVVVKNARTELLEREAERLKRHVERQGGFFETYHDYDEIQQFLDETVANYSTAELETIGQTFLGRDMRLLKICENGVCGNNPTMFIQCNIHAREWITSGACLFMINELTANLAANPGMNSGLDWYILTPANPDGYVFTWTDERFWRMTRQPHIEGVGICVGVDPNRNFGAGFGGVGTSTDPCSLVNHGPEAFSEFNTRNIRDFVLNHNEIVYYQDLHAYGLMAMYPYGYTPTDCADKTYLQDLCDEAHVALNAVHNMTYECGSIYDVVYPAAGVACDWAYEGAGIVTSFTFESRPASAAEGGFAPPASEILPNAQEIWAWHKVVAERLKMSPP